MRIKTHIGNVDIQLNTNRIDRNLKNAQKKLDEDVLKDTTPYVSKGGTGYLRGSGHVVPGGGEVVWEGPYAHFQYVGYVRTDENGRVWVGENEQKPILTDRPLKYQQPGAEKEFFEAAKRDHKEEWISDARKEVGKE